ncbi:ribosome silencing factor [Oleomonas cavernae]|uniref:ribosome silencing factor n=1 Tax=Oleomonas cavernae TaxID=2320859 RepID=UPI001F30E9B9|nr:ribosome silencing factor [Oleomonas cavernae]
MQKKLPAKKLKAEPAETIAEKPKRARAKKVAEETVAAEPAPKKSRAKPKAKKKAGPTDGAKVLLDLVVKTLDDNKGEEILTIDLAGKSSIADFMVIANGRSGRQVTALANYVVDAIAKAGLPPCRTEGKSAGDWVLIDAGDVIVHLFRPEVREFYKLEKMWQADFRPEAEHE